MGRESMSNNPSVNITQIKKGSVINGNMESKHSIRVDGHITGDLKTEEKVIIGIHGEIDGNLWGADITIEGYVMGDVMAQGNLHVSHDAEIEGKVFAKEISIEKGAQLNGSIAVGTDIAIPELEMEEATPSQPREMQLSGTEPKPAAAANGGTVAW